jgi:hypothetical protein
VPVNKLTELERRRILDVLNSERFVDQAPLEVYAQLLDEGTYLCSVSTMYRVLRGSAAVIDRPGSPATRPRRARNWSRPSRGRCTQGTSPNSPDR